jgi:DNA-binding NarL/FixJ family response regulator
VTRTRLQLSVDDPLARAGLQALLAPAATLELVEERPDVVLWTGAGAPPPGPAPVLALVADARAGGTALRQGARGVLLRHAGAPALEAAVAAVARGLLVLEPGLRLLGREPDAADVAELTAREREVLQLVSLGLANKEVARRLGVSDSTVKFHVNAILEKLGARSRTDAVVRAARLGLLVL